MAWFWPIFAQTWSQKCFSWVLPLLDVIHCCKLSLYATSRKTNTPNLRKWEKTLFQARFYPIWPKFWLKNLALSVTRYHGQLSTGKISKKLMIPSWENLVTDGQTDENDLMGRCPTNVERPKSRIRLPSKLKLIFH